MRIFHQNMQNYSGGNGIAANGLRTRNAQFDRDFANIQNAMGGPSVLVAGFTELLNNTTTVGDPSSAFSALNSMMSAIHSAVGGPATRDYVGGDYNLDPRDPKRRAPLEYVCAETATGYWKDTTWYNCYDYWLTNSGPNQLPMTNPVINTANAATHYQTLWSHASDHCGISLQFPVGG